LAASLFLLAGCGGSGDSTATTATTAGTAPATGGTGTSGPIDVQALYEANCQSCHGIGGQGASGPPLTNAASQDEDTLKNLISSGGAAMPAFQGRLTPEEIDELVDWIREDLSQGSTATTSS